jgi:pimeloyl-ACP methyl ester carboxylesterase
MPYYDTGDGATIYFEDTGSGSPILLVHGYASSHHVFDRNVPGLRETNRVVSVDLRGHGASQPADGGFTLLQYATDLAALRRHLDLDSVHVVAWAMGGKVVLEYLQQYDAAPIESVSFVETSPRTLSGNGWDLRPEPLDHAANLETLHSMCRCWSGFVERFYCPYIFSDTHEDKHPADSEWIRDMATRTAERAAVSTWISLADRDYRPMLPDVPVPCLVAHGTRSALYTKAIADYMVDQIPDATAVEFGEAGHALHVERPTAFNERLRSFLNRVQD